MADDDPEVLKLNAWHVVELFFGQIARFDTYLCVCFLSLVAHCQMAYIAWPVASFCLLQLIYPLYTLFSLIRMRADLTHTLPRVERNAQIAFVRENMMLATVFDSFCINNFRTICTK